VSDPAVVYGVGVACPLGLTAPAAFAAANAGVRLFAEIDGVVDEAGQPARGCRHAELQTDEAFERAVWFARRAATEALLPIAELSDVRVPVFAAVSGLNGNENSANLLAAELRSAAPPGVRLEWVRGGFFDEGRAGGTAAVHAAMRALDSAPLALAGGLDCQVAGETIRDLSRRNLLLGLRNCDGRLPGEGAAFVLLGRSGARGLEQLGALHAVARARDPKPFDGAAPASAAGLTEVFASLRARWDGRVGEVVAAQSTERFWATELSTAYLRNIELMPEPMRVRHLANVLGDCGAAAFPLGMAWALSDFDDYRHGRDGARSALVVSSSDGGIVGGGLLSAVT
jgi:3-oxoacyl-[acyl-carrier-protein] synthase-1